ncbi:MAG: M23 family metallopeptidase [Lachnospiraceae bacterium]|nr:M23 family metallopeptidase [Lachnoclostridium sp.]MDD7522154.1 M23 family metallopeptidase [Lachnoclostridium sp.]MDY2599117.1 M23 family metallopeptidase [Lachnospiraceae bacterium]
MRRNRISEMLKGKAFYISLMAGAICVVAVAALCLDTTGVKNKGKNDQKLAQIEQSDNSSNKQLAADSSERTEGKKSGLTGERSEGSKSELEGDKLAGNKPGQTGDTSVGKKSANKKTELTVDKLTGKKTDRTGKKSTEKKSEQTDEKANAKKISSTEKIPVMKAGKDVQGMKFDEEKGLKWPVKGEVIMKFSGETPVYFKTLAQYKSNPAILIAAKEGVNVCAPCDGIVSDVGKDEEIGEYLELSIGDNYKIRLGQLENIQVKKGDNIEEGQLIASVSEPTKYYTLEETNVYMKMTNDGEAVDPLLYLR